MKPLLGPMQGQVYVVCQINKRNETGVAMKTFLLHCVMNLCTVFGHLVGSVVTLVTLMGT